MCDQELRKTKSERVILIHIHQMLGMPVRDKAEPEPAHDPCPTTAFCELVTIGSSIIEGGKYRGCWGGVILGWPRCAF